MKRLMKLGLPPAFRWAPLLSAGLLAGCEAPPEFTRAPLEAAPPPEADQCDPGTKALEGGQFRLVDLGTGSSCDVELETDACGVSILDDCTTQPVVREWRGQVTKQDPQEPFSPVELDLRRLAKLGASGVGERCGFEVSPFEGVLHNPERPSQAADPPETWALIQPTSPGLPDPLSQRHPGFYLERKNHRSALMFEDSFSSQLPISDFAVLATEGKLLLYHQPEQQLIVRDLITAQGTTIESTIDFFAVEEQLWILENDGIKIRHLNTNAVLETITTKGDGGPPFDNPQKIGIARGNKNVFVSDAEGVHWFRRTPEFPFMGTTPIEGEVQNLTASTRGLLVASTSATSETLRLRLLRTSTVSGWPEAPSQTWTTTVAKSTEVVAFTKKDTWAVIMRDREPTMFTVSTGTTAPSASAPIALPFPVDQSFRVSDNVVGFITPCTPSAGPFTADQICRPSSDPCFYRELNYKNGSARRVGVPGIGQPIRAAPNEKGTLIVIWGNDGFSVLDRRNSILRPIANNAFRRKAEEDGFNPTTNHIKSAGSTFYLNLTLPDQTHQILTAIGRKF